MSYVFQVSDRPYFDYNLASHGRPNRFILTESSRVGEREGGPVRNLFYTYHWPVVQKNDIYFFTFEGTNLATLCYMTSSVMNEHDVL